MSHRRLPGGHHLLPFGCPAAMGVAERLLKQARMLAKHWKDVGSDQDLEEALTRTHVACRYFAELAQEALLRRDRARRQLLLNWAEECFWLFMELRETWERRRLKASGQRVPRARRHRWTRR